MLSKFDKEQPRLLHSIDLSDLEGHPWFFCSCRNVFHLNLTAAAAAASPDEEKQTLLENVEVGVEDKEQEEKKP